MGGAATAAAAAEGGGTCSEGVWRPVFARTSGAQQEAWLMVVEKAFAKLHGCYEALAGGQVASALSYLITLTLTPTLKP